MELARRNFLQALGVAAGGFCIRPVARGCKQRGSGVNTPPEQYANPVVTPRWVIRKFGRSAMRIRMLAR